MVDTDYPAELRFRFYFERLVTVWFQEMRTLPRTAASLVLSASFSSKASQRLRAALLPVGERDGELCPRRVGWHLSAWAGREAGGYRLEKLGERPSGGRRGLYRVVKVRADAPGFAVRPDSGAVRPGAPVDDSGQLAGAEVEGTH